MDFITAVTKNDIEKVRGMLQSGIEVNNPVLWNSKNTYSPVIPHEKPNRTELLNNDQEYQCKALNIAVLGGHADMTRLLLSAGADINSKDGRGRTALVCAIYGLDLDAQNINTLNLNLISQTNPHHLNIIRNIILCHPNLYYATLDSPQYEIKGITPLCLTSYLGKTEIIQLLLDDGRVNVDGTDSKNATALMYAARDGTVPVVKLLLRNNASPDMTDSHGWSAVQYAERSPEIVQLCEQVLRMKRAEYSGPEDGVEVKYPLNYTRLSHLISTMPSYPSSLSHLQFETVQEVDLLDPAAQPLLQIIQSAFLQAIKLHDHLSLQTMLLKPPSLNAHQVRHGPPLLINHHDPKTGLTALHHAMRTKPLPSLETLKLLYHAGADVNAQTYYGRTALHHLARFGLDAEGSWGIQKSPSGTYAPTETETPEHLAACASLLIRLGALVNMADPTGNTPLHFAAEFGGIVQVIAVLILEGNADIYLKNKKGLSALDVCKSRKTVERMVLLNGERKLSRSRSIYSLSGTIRPFDSASEYNRTSWVVPWKESDEANDFEVILKSFYNYQTSFTDAIESSLAFLTDSVVGQWKEPVTMAQLEKTTFTLRLELREAHEMFDVTEQRVEKVMMAFREELEEIEQVHQADWETSELQHDKIEKLFDVLERIEGRYCALEMAQQGLVQQMESLRKVAGRQQPAQVGRDPGIAIVHLSQALLILQSLPSDPTLHVRDDKSRLCADVQAVLEEVTAAMACFDGDASQKERMEEAQEVLQQRWSRVELAVSAVASPEIPALPAPVTARARRLDAQALYTLNELELQFEIQHTNLHEIQRDLQAIADESETMSEQQKGLYERCVRLETALARGEGDGSETKAEHSQVLYWAQQLLNRKHSLANEKAALLKEHSGVEQALEETRSGLEKIRPPVLLQSLLERLDTDEEGYPGGVKIEKDWKEDANLVVECVTRTADNTTDDYPDLGELELKQVEAQCRQRLSAQAYMVRLDAGLYALKVLTHKYLTRSRQALLDVQAVLGQASSTLEETRQRMTQLYDDAAEVARQVFALKTELETIVRHRKEEVVKVWEVVDEVSESVKAKIAHSTGGRVGVDRPGQAEGKDDPDRHQWILRELEQLQHAYESLQVAVHELKQEQAMIGQSLKQLGSHWIEPQVLSLVGQEPTSLLSVSDQLTELIDHIKDGQVGLRPVPFWSSTFSWLPKKSCTRLSQLTPTGPRLPNSATHRSLYHSKSSFRTDKKRMSIISATSLSSLSSYQQERILSKASCLSQALSKANQTHFTNKI